MLQVKVKFSSFPLKFPICSPIIFDNTLERKLLRTTKLFVIYSFYIDCILTYGGIWHYNHYICIWSEDINEGRKTRVPDFHTLQKNEVHVDQDHLVKRIQGSDAVLQDIQVLLGNPDDMLTITRQYRPRPLPRQSNLDRVPPPPPHPPVIWTGYPSREQTHTGENITFRRTTYMVANYLNIATDYRSVPT